MTYVYLYRVQKKSDNTCFHEVTFWVNFDSGKPEVTDFGVYDRTIVGEREETLVTAEIDWPLATAIPTNKLGGKQYYKLTKESYVFLDPNVQQMVLIATGLPKERIQQQDIYQPDGMRVIGRAVGDFLVVSQSNSPVLFIPFFTIKELLDLVGLTRQELINTLSSSRKLSEMSDEEKRALASTSGVKPTSLPDVGQASSVNTRRSPVQPPQVDPARNHKLVMGLGVVLSLIFLSLLITSALALAGIHVPGLILLAPKLLMTFTALSSVLLVASLGTTAGAWWTMPKSSNPGFMVQPIDSALPPPRLVAPHEEKTCSWMFDCMHRICPDSHESQGYSRVPSGPN